MATHRSKRYKVELKKISEKCSQQPEKVDAALQAIVDSCSVKFDPSLDLAVNLNIDPKKSDQSVRGFAVLPHGLGKEVKVAVFARGNKIEEAKQAGADYVGAEDLVVQIQEGLLDFHTVIATPECMTLVAKVGKILGPRGLMPNPKSGTVTQDVAHAVKEAKAGKVEFKNDKGGTVHVQVGKISFGVEKLKENLIAVMHAIMKAKPQTVKAGFIKRAFISHSQGPSVEIRVADIV